MPSARILVNDFVQVNLYGQSAAQGSQNAFHFKCTSIVGAGALVSDAAILMDATFASLMKALMSNESGYTGTMVQVVAPTRKPFAVANANAGAGVAGTPGVARQVAGLFSKITSFTGQANRGRFYIPFPAAADDDTNGFPTAGYMTRMGFLAAAVIQNFTITSGADTSTIEAVIFHKGSPGTTTTVITATARQKWATQRRRGSYGKPNYSYPG
jgi:hypothetical protein